MLHLFNNRKIRSFERYLLPARSIKGSRSAQSTDKLPRERVLAPLPQEKILEWIQSQNHDINLRTSMRDSEQVAFALGWTELRGFTDAEILTSIGFKHNRRGLYLLNISTFFQYWDAIPFGSREDSFSTPADKFVIALMRLAPLKYVVEKPTYLQVLEMMYHAKGIISFVVSNVIEKKESKLPKKTKPIFLPLFVAAPFPKDFFGIESDEKPHRKDLNKKGLGEWFFIRYAINLTSAYYIDFFNIEDESTIIISQLQQTAQRLWPDNYGTQRNYIATVLKNLCLTYVIPKKSGKYCNLG